jgi:cyclic pyranopterin phosphate synthase
MVSLGIRKVRLTGGEPSLRPDLEEIVARIGGMGQIQDLAMTTNGLGLAKRLPALKRAGLMRLNISLDSLRPEPYRDITRGGDLEQVFETIEAALAAGLTPVKLNCVVLRGKNDGEIDAFIALARDRPLHVRFIELMPLGELDYGGLRISSSRILEAHGELQRIAPQPSGQPAEQYGAPGFLGAVGFISPLSRSFCGGCNRVRITSDGRLRPCLGDNREADLRGAMRAGDSELLRIIRETVFNKPQGHRFYRGFTARRTMHRIGG